MIEIGGHSSGSKPLVVSLSCASDELSPFHMLHIHHALCQAGCIIVVRYVWPIEDPSTKRDVGRPRHGAIVRVASSRVVRVELYDYPCGDASGISNGAKTLSASAIASKLSEPTPPLPFNLSRLLTLVVVS